MGQTTSRTGRLAAGALLMMGALLVGGCVPYTAANFRPQDAGHAEAWAICEKTAQPCLCMATYGYSYAPTATDYAAEVAAVLALQTQGAAGTGVRPCN